jgi:hypothetical protein
MRFNNNEQPYLNSLRENLVYPPFSEIKELVLSHEARDRGLALFALPMMEVAVLALIAVAVLWQSSPSPTIPGAKQSIAGMASLEKADQNSLTQHQIKSDLSFPSSRPQGKRESRLMLQPQGLYSRLRGNDKVYFDNDKALNTDIAINAKPTTDFSQDNTKQNPTPGHSPENKITQSVLPSNPSQNAIFNSNSDIASIESRDVPSVHWVAYVLGNSQLPSAGAPLQLLGGSAGVRYKIGGASSLIMELRDNSFVIGKISTGTSFHDTTIFFYGWAYRSVLGSTQYVNWSASIASLDFGYRFELMPESPLSPFAEALIGGSIYGALSSEVVGIRYDIASPFLFDVAARGDQLFSPGSAPLKSFGLEAGIGFAW